VTVWRWLLVGLVLLTRPDGKPLWIVDTNIVAIGQAIGGPPQANAEVFTGAGTYWVRETPFAVAKKLGWKP